MSSDGPTRTRSGRLLRYSLRTLLVFVTLSAVTVAFRASQVSRQRRAVHALESAGGMVGYFDEGWWPVRGYGRVPLDDSAAGWLREFFGLRWPGEVYLKGSSVTDEVLKEYVLPLKTLGVVGLTETSVTNEGLVQLAALPNLSIATLRSNANHDAIWGKLQESTAIEFQDVPLQDAMDYLADLHQISFTIDCTTVSPQHLDGQRPLTATIKNEKLDDALTKLLAPSELGWVISDGKLLITSRAVQDEHDALIESVQAKLPQVKVLLID